MQSSRWAALLCPYMSYPMSIHVYIYVYIIYPYMSPIYAAPYMSSPLYNIPRWPVLGSGRNNAGQLTAIHTTCCGVARLVLLRHATGRAIRSTRTTSRASGRGKSCNCRTTGESYDQPRQWRTTRDLSPDHRTTVAQQMTTRLRQDATTSVAARLLHMVKATPSGVATPRLRNPVLVGPRLTNSLIHSLKWILNGANHFDMI